MNEDTPTRDQRLAAIERRADVLRRRQIALRVGAAALMIAVSAATVRLLAADGGAEDEVVLADDPTTTVRPTTASSSTTSTTLAEALPPIAITTTTSAPAEPAVVLPSKAYRLDRTSGRVEVVALRSGTVERVIADVPGAIGLHDTMDGRWLYYTELFAGCGAGIGRVATDGVAPEVVFGTDGPLPDEVMARWLAAVNGDGDRIAFFESICESARPAEDPARSLALVIVDVATGAEVRREAAPNGIDVAAALSADGGTLALAGFESVPPMLLDVASGTWTSLPGVHGVPIALGDGTFLYDSLGDVVVARPDGTVAAPPGWMQGGATGGLVQADPAGAWIARFDGSMTSLVTPSGVVAAVPGDVAAVFAP